MFPLVSQGTPESPNIGRQTRSDTALCWKLLQLRKSSVRVELASSERSGSEPPTWAVATPAT